MSFDVRAATLADFPHFERLERADALHERSVCAATETLRHYWFGPRTHAFLVEDGGAVVGVFRVRPIRDGVGAHVAHSTFLVDPARRGHGIGTRMAERAVVEARRLGFRAMQFGFVPVTLTRSIALWQRLGFAIVGTLPGCWRDPARGDVDAVVLHRELGEGQALSENG